MKKYRTGTEKKELSGEEMLKYKDFGKLTHNYQRALRSLHGKPLYRNPKSFLWLLLILLLAWLLSDLAGAEKSAPLPAQGTEESAPLTAP